MLRNVVVSSSLLVILIGLVHPGSPLSGQQEASADDPVRELVRRLDLDRYKATIRGLAVFGDRRQGTARNRAAVDWTRRLL